MTSHEKKIKEFEQAAAKEGFDLGDPTRSILLKEARDAGLHENHVPAPSPSPQNDLFHVQTGHSLPSSSKRRGDMTARESAGAVVLGESPPAFSLPPSPTSTADSNGSSVRVPRRSAVSTTNATVSGGR